MKLSRYAAPALAAALVFAATATPAYARVTVSRAESICEAAAIAQFQPTPARVRARAEGATRERYRISLAVFDAEGARRNGECLVNRESGEATVTLAE